MNVEKKRRRKILMKFKENHYFMLDEKELDRKESITFIECLEDEKKRHENARSLCLALLSKSDKPEIFMLFMFSSYKRHQQDIDMIQASIDYLVEKWNL